MPFEIKKVGNKFSVINSNTGYIHSKGTTLKKAKAQVRLLHSITGEGVGDYFNTIIYGRNDLPPSVRNKLRKWGNEPIVSIVIGRKPLGTPIMTALEIASGFTFKEKLEQTPYEKLFHLFLGITTTKHKFTYEKEEVVAMNFFNRAKREGTEFRNIHIQDGLTMNNCIEKQRELMGGKFLTYSSKDNNCQDFVKAFLEANNIGNSDDVAWVKQDVYTLFENNDTLRKISNSVTDLGAKVNEIVYGTGTLIKGIRKPRKEIIDHKQSHEEYLKTIIDNDMNVKDARKKVIKKYKSVNYDKDKDKDNKKIDKDKVRLDITKLLELIKL
jgi:hypothetical protein